MTDTNDKMTMPPGFWWKPDPSSLSEYGVLRQRVNSAAMGYYSESEAIEIAHALVRPAVEAATAELRAELRKALEAVTEYACREAQARARAEKAEADLARVTAERDRLREARDGAYLRDASEADMRAALSRLAYATGFYYAGDYESAPAHPMEVADAVESHIRSVADVEDAVFEIKRLTDEWVADPRHRQYGEALRVWFPAAASRGEGE